MQESVASSQVVLPFSRFPSAHLLQVLSSGSSDHSLFALFGMAILMHEPVVASDLSDNEVCNGRSDQSLPPPILSPYCIARPWIHPPTGLLLL